MELEKSIDIWFKDNPTMSRKQWHSLKEMLGKEKKDDFSVF